MTKRIHHGEGLPNSTLLADFARVVFPWEPFQRIEILSASKYTVCRHLIANIKSGHGGRLATVNTDQLQQVASQPELRVLLEPPVFVVPDGMPILWGAAIAGAPLEERIAGADLIWLLSQHAAQSGVPIVLLGGPTGAPGKAESVLTRKFSGLRVLASYSPPYGFESSASEWSKLLDVLDISVPAIVFCGFGFPKQELVISRLYETMPRCWFISCGAAIEMVAGMVSRAPTWIQRLGFEWLYRLVQEPVRLSERYLVRGLPFTSRFLYDAGRWRWTLRRRERGTARRKGRTGEALLELSDDR
jgi:N-acetylglucosaminyldiphosphoundecaprenol N-acetyl-beta-D-mannosaminyltransferase